MINELYGTCPQEDAQVFIEERSQAAVILNSYMKWGRSAKAFVATEKSILPKRISNGEGRYKKLNDNERVQVEGIAHLHVAMDLCGYIEDYASLLNACGNDLREFHKSIRAQKNPRNIIENINTNGWFEILKYGPMHGYGLRPDELDILNRIRMRVVLFHKMVADVALEFLERHWITYNAFKHGGQLLYGLRKIELNGNYYWIFPSLDNPKNHEITKAAIVSELTTYTYQRLHDLIFMAVEDIMNRNMEHISCVGARFVELNNRFVYEDETTFVKNIFDKIPSPIKYPINMQLTLNVKKDSCDSFAKLQNKINDAVRSFNTGTGLEYDSP